MSATLVKESQPDAREPGFLFILNPAYCGSTAFAHFLMSSGRALGAHVNAEGQWLPAVRDRLTTARWSPAKTIAWDEVKREWIAEWRLRASQWPQARILVEKSPPNLLRAREMERAFPGAKFIVLMRDPYAWAWSYRSRENSREDFAQVARLWLDRASRLRAHVKDLRQVLQISYEELVARPLSVKSKVEAFYPEIGNLDADVEFQVKDYPRARLADHNARQIANLSGDDRNAITGALADDPETVSFFGYDILPLQG